MGQSPLTELSDFTGSHVKDRDLIIKMLKYEDSLIHNDVGMMYKTPSYLPSQSLNVEWAVQRLVLTHFGFSNSDDDVLNYRKIFRKYYKNPLEFDREVLDSVSYMKHNKCVYYTQPVIKTGDVVRDQLHTCHVLAPHCCRVNLLNTVDQSPFHLHFIAAFSTS